MAKKSSVLDDGTAPEATDSKYARTRRRILDAAAHFLTVKGYAGTRLSDVADYAEVQAPAIYYYFASRDDLIEEVMYSGIADMRVHLEDVLTALPDTTSPLDRITAAMEAHLRHELDLSDYTSASIRNARQIPEPLRARQQQEESAYGLIWRGLLEDAVASGEMRADLDVRAAQMLLLGALNWAAEWFIAGRDSLDLLVATAQALVRTGIGPTNDDVVAPPARKRA
ncbi:TetR/AcrR family transcriptional regulator [Mycobacterium sp.]|uniref:TetR/AcrR family transcriptional regulator n=1 Tax=Mycobacterium sp. TaxID=1785 RepID=UPI0025D42041|nr:TetR/AcrR family transcriptional regulator [Mycobacterium sp.]